MRDRDRANKNKIEIFVFSVSSNDFPHDMLLHIARLVPFVCRPPKASLDESRPNCEMTVGLGVPVPGTIVLS